MAMKQIGAREILDMAMVGTSATLLAKRWESALLVNVDNDTLARLMANKETMDALMKIEGFRSLTEDIKTIIEKSEAVKKTKKNGDDLPPKKKCELPQQEKEYKSKRKQIQEKFIKFATRIPVFMYLTDYREQCLKDVITQLEPELFQRVTGLAVKDFDLLVSLGVFNDALMNVPFTSSSGMKTPVSAISVWTCTKVKSVAAEIRSSRERSSRTSLGNTGTSLLKNL